MDKNLVDSIKALNQSGIDYWLINGSMLGLARDKRLIEWDSDIDYAISLSKETYSKISDVHELLKSAGFTGGIHRRLRPGKPVLKYKRDGGRSIEFVVISHEASVVDLTWYKTERGDGGESLNMVKKLAHSLTSLMGKFPDHELAFGGICLDMKSPWKSYIRDFAVKLNFDVQARLQYLRTLFGLGETLKYSYVSGSFDGYSVIIDKDSGVLCRVPKHYEKCCESIYGLDWRRPHRSTHWTDYMSESSEADLK